MDTDMTIIVMEGWQADERTRRCFWRACGKVASLDGTTTYGRGPSV